MLFSSLFASLILLPVVDSFIYAKPQYLADFSVPGQEQTPRDLFVYTYSGGPTSDLVAPTQTCRNIGGLSFQCDLHQRVGDPTNYMDVNITVECKLDTTTGQDYRRATGCQCWALLASSDPERPSKECPCYTCPRGFGQSSISIDCTHLIDDDNSTSSPSPTPVNETTDTPVSAPTGITTAPATTGVSGTVTIAQATPTATSASPTLAPTVTGTVGQGTPTAPVGAPTIAPTTTGTVGQGTPTTPVGTTTIAPTPTGTIVQATATPSSARQTSTPSIAPVATQTLSPSSAPTGNVTKPDPYIFATCTSVDCQGNCNGTCSLGCDAAGSVCPFCQARTPQPTGTPDTTSGSAALTGMMSVCLAAAALMMI